MAWTHCYSCLENLPLSKATTLGHLDQRRKKFTARRYTLKNPPPNNQPVVSVRLTCHQNEYCSRLSCESIEIDLLWSCKAFLYKTYKRKPIRFPFIWLRQQHYPCPTLTQSERGRYRGSIWYHSWSPLCQRFQNLDYNVLTMRHHHPCNSACKRNMLLFNSSHLIITDETLLNGLFPPSRITSLQIFVAYTLIFH